MSRYVIAGLTGESRQRFATGGHPPYGGGAKALDIGDFLLDAADIAAAVFRLHGRVEFADALIVVNRVAVVEAVGHAKATDRQLVFYDMILTARDAARARYLRSATHYADSRK